MDKNTLIILAAAGVGLWFVTKATAKPTVTTNGAASLNAGGAVKVPQDLTSIFGPTYATQKGWQYFADGSAIGPDGAKYSNGLF